MKVQPDTATLIEGVGDGQVSDWPIVDAAPMVIGRGAAGGWLTESTWFGSAPDTRQPPLMHPEFQPCTGPIWPTFIDLSPWSIDRAKGEGFACNVIVAAADKWMASNGSRTIGTGLPDGYETGWQAHAIGDDGTVILVLNGVYRVFWATGGTTDLKAPQVSISGGVVLTVEHDIITMHTANWTHEPDQIPGAKWWVTFIQRFGIPWLVCLPAAIGKLVAHRADDAKQGHTLDSLSPYSPVACALPNSDETLIAWSEGPAEQAGDIRRVSLVLEENQQPFILPTPEPPDPEPPDPTPEPPDPSPEPEPPMPPVTNYPTPKDRALFENLCSVAVHQVTGMPTDGPTGAWQGVHETCDKIDEFKLPWDAYCAMQGAFVRNSVQTMIVPDAQLRDLCKRAAVINSECLQ